MKYAVLSVLLLTSPAFAQHASEKAYTLTVTGADLAILAEGLGEVPAKRANAVIMKLNQQIQIQDAPPPAKPADDKPKP